MAAMDVVSRLNGDLRRLVLLVSALSGFNMAFVASAQSPELPIAPFEVASVKANRSGVARGEFRPEPGRLTVVNMTLRFIIQQAFGLRDYQIVGAPGWANSEKFDIVAKAVGTADKAEVRRMLQPLLAERFGFAVHRERRDLPIFELQIAKNGPKVSAPSPNSEARSSSPDTKVVRVIGDAGMFAEALSRPLGRPVVDKTGLSGFYDFLLVMKVDEAPGSTWANGDNIPAAGLPSSIFSALQEQLGLKLEPRRGPVEVLVIDHIERPSEN